MPAIAILSVGTRGDVQPFLALALELKSQGERCSHPDRRCSCELQCASHNIAHHRRFMKHRPAPPFPALLPPGHNPVIMTHDDFKSSVEQAGIAFESLGIAPARARVEQQVAQKVAAASIFKKLAVTKEFFCPLLTSWCHLSQAALEKISKDHSGVDLLVTGTLGAWFTPSLSEYFKTRFAVVHFMPFYPTTEFAPPVASDGSSMMFTMGKWGMAEKVHACDC